MFPHHSTPLAVLGSAGASCIGLAEGFNHGTRQDHFFLGRKLSSSRLSVRKSKGTMFFIRRFRVDLEFLKSGLIPGQVRSTKRKSNRHQTLSFDNRTRPPRESQSMDSNDFGQRIKLQEVSDSDGSLAICEPDQFGLFDVQRIYFIHSLKPNARRGGHAHRELHQLIIAASGKFRLDLFRFGEAKSIMMDKPSEACYVPPWTWRDISDFSDTAVCLVLASETYSESDYIRDFSQFTTESQAVMQAGGS